MVVSMAPPSTPWDRRPDVADRSARSLSVDNRCQNCFWARVMPSPVWVDKEGSAKRGSVLLLIVGILSLGMLLCACFSGKKAGWRMDE